MKEYFNLIFGPQGLMFIGGIATVAGAFWTASRDLKNEKELNKKNAVIIEKTEKIAELNDQIVKILTGGESFPYILFGTTDGVHGMATIHLSGDHAISNVSGNLIDIRELRREQRLGKLGFSVGINFSKNIISPAFATPVINYSNRVDLSKGKRYLAHFYTPYHTFQQQIAIEPSKKNGIPLQAFKIYKDKKLIHSEHPENFPIPLEEIDFLEDLTQEEFDELRRQNEDSIRRGFP